MSWIDALNKLPVDAPIYLAGGCAEPTAVIAAAAADPGLFAGRLVYTGFIPGVNTADPIAGADNARLRSLFPNKATPTDRHDLLPWPYSRYYEWLARPGSIGMAFCQVARTATGDISLGLSADFMPALLAAGVPVIGQINPSLTAAPGAPTVPKDRFARLFEADTPLPVYDEGTPDLVAAKIGHHVASLIETGDTVQLGLGKIQAGVLDALAQNSVSISIHGGMISAAASPLIDSGLLRAGTAGVLLGTRSFYDRAGELDGIRLVPVGETHNIRRLLDIARLTTVNSVLSIDLYGQAAAETIAGRTISAPGGLPDFHRAALSADNGRAILVMRATMRDGHSNIVANHPPGTRICLGALDADIIVTEFGVADVRHCCVEERGRSLIRIAAPEHRDTLSRQWAGRG